MSIDIVEQVFKAVLARFAYLADLEQYGELEHWELPAGVELLGDCEDFALACRAALRVAGVGDTRLVVCRDETGAGHCILEWHGWVLDNRQSAVVRREDLPYRWIKISGYAPGDAWHEIIN